MRKTIVTSEIIVLGRQGEDGANKVLFPVRGWKELYGDGQFVVTVQRPDENDPYPVSSALVGMFVEWIVGSADVEIPGRGKVELAYYTSDNVRVKSVVYHTVIYDALGQNSLTPPEPWQSWVDAVEEAGADAIQAAEDAEDARDDAKDYRDEAQEYASDAEGYKNDAQTAAQNAQGAVSTAFSQITATATTLSPGSSATASFDPSTKVMSFGIPRGQDGGPDGIFWAEYGVTSYADVKAAIDAGKYVVVRKNDRVGILISITNPFLIFAAPFATRNYIVFLYSNNTWTETEYIYEQQGKITVGSTEYTPTRKALAITENGVTTTYYVADIT